MNPRGLSAAILAVMVLPMTISAQTATGRMAGTVLDPSGSAIPAAQVTVRSESTVAAVVLETNMAGAFSASALAPGLYTVEISSPGFRTHSIEHLKVDVARETSVPPVLLELGVATEVVVVEGGVNQVQTTNAEVSSIVTARPDLGIADHWPRPPELRPPAGRRHLQRDRNHCDQRPAHIVLDRHDRRHQRPGQLHSHRTPSTTCRAALFWTRSRSFR